MRLGMKRKPEAAKAEPPKASRNGKRPSRARRTIVYRTEPDARPSPLPRVFAFIDSQNLNLGIQSLNWKLDFARFRIYLSDKYHVAKAFLFIGFLPDNLSLYNYLQKSGYIVIFKPTLPGKKKGQEIVKGNVDAELVLQAIVEFGNYDKAIIVSGDGDFYCLIEHLANTGKLYKIIVPNRKYSSLLRKFSPYIVMADMLKEKVKKNGDAGEDPK